MNSSIVPAATYCDDCGQRLVRNRHCSGCNAEWSRVATALPTSRVCVIVTGGRHYLDRKRVFEILDKIHAEEGICSIAHGACGVENIGTTIDASLSESDNWWKLRGADRWADQWAWSRGVGCYRYPANWSAGPSAGPKRNQEMLEAEQASLSASKELVVVHFPGGKGTAGMTELARAAGVRLVDGRPEDRNVPKGDWADYEMLVPALHRAGWTPAQIANLTNFRRFCQGRIELVYKHGMVTLATPNGLAILYSNTFDRVKDMLTAFGGNTIEGEIEAWCDGSGTTADQPAGAGGVIEFKWCGGARSEIEISEHLGPGSNNFAELQAAYWVLKHVPVADAPLVIRSDSQYMIGVLSNPTWKPKEHVQLISRIKADLSLRRCVIFEHVRGHNGDEYNERADRLANAARKRQ